MTRCRACSCTCACASIQPAARAGTRAARALRCSAPTIIVATSSIHASPCTPGRGARECCGRACSSRREPRTTISIDRQTALQLQPPSAVRVLWHAGSGSASGSAPVQAVATSRGFCPDIRLLLQLQTTLRTTTTPRMSARCRLGIRKIQFPSPELGKLRESCAYICCPLIFVTRLL